jgi:anaerobic ribonucleoside-triphosphate reductase activating protein
MRYAGINYNDFSAAPGVSVTLFTQGCPHRCKGCHNPETWDYNGGKEFTPDIPGKIVDALCANGIKRSFCIMGGEPLCEDNLFLTTMVLQYVKLRLPEVKVYIWTGYLYEDLLMEHNPTLNYIFSKVDVLVDGPYIQEQRDITLKARGSRNQRIIYLQPQ